jgi:hypothetical protein
MPKPLTNSSSAEAKQAVIEQLAKGATVAQACGVAGRHPKTYEAWRRADPDFALAVDRIRHQQSTGQRGVVEALPFPEFCERFLGVRVFPHIQNVVDLIEGRPPAWLHPSMVLEQGEPDLLICNMPPEHSKTTSITINYVVYRICMDPNVRIILISKTQSMARKMLLAIKSRLTHPKYADLIAAYGPQGGFEKGSESWTQDMIYVSSDVRDSGEKDPTVQALGIRGHVYGARADLIVMDDCVDLTNAHEHEKQIDWVQSEVISRVSASGSLLVVGTRLAARDLYSELRDPSKYPDEQSPWTYFSEPAVLEFADDAADWKTLWSHSNIPEIGAKGADTQPNADGLYPKWDGPRLLKKRQRMSPRTWAQVYMQQQTSDSSVFDPDAIRAAINGARMTGNMPVGMPGVRERGMDGLIVVAGLDPAMSGHTAAVVIGLDASTNMRYVLDVFNNPGTTPDGIRELIYRWTDKYNITEWRVEKNAFQAMLTQDREVREFLSGRGAILREHFTGTNKWDADFGIASMTTMFAGWKDKNQLVELPSTSGSEAMKAFIEQLVTWHPDAKKGTKTDIVMAFWFTELACRDRIQTWSHYGRNHQSNPFLTPWDINQQSVINIGEYEMSRMMGGVA